MSHRKNESKLVEYGSYGAFEYGLVTESEIRNTEKTLCIFHLLKRWSKYHLSVQGNIEGQVKRGYQETHKIEL